MRIVLSIGNVIIVTLVGFLGIIGLLHLLKLGENAPVVGGISHGALAAWESAQAA